MRFHDCLILIPTIEMASQKTLPPLSENALTRTALASKYKNVHTGDLQDGGDLTVREGEQRRDAAVYTRIRSRVDRSFYRNSSRRVS